MDNNDLKIEFLTGKTDYKTKKILSNLKNGQIDLLIGTIPCFKKIFQNLGLVVIDEQHKFGVKQK